MLHSRVALRASCVKIMNMFAWAAALPRGDSVMLPPASRVAVSISAFSVITAVFERTAVSVPAGLGWRRGTIESKPAPWWNFEVDVLRLLFVINSFLRLK